MLIEELYEKHKTELNRFANSIACNEKEAEDILQETFVRSLGNEEKLERLSSYQQRAWLYKVLRNVLYDMRRRGRREVPYQEKDEPQDSFDIEHIVIRELVAKLPPKFKEVVYQKYWLGLNSNQIAKDLNIPDSTVRYRLREAITQLKKQI